MSAHTPGPWVLDWNVSRIDLFSADSATLIASLRRSSLSEGIDATAKANARLLAAAPELFEALQLVGMSAGWQYMTQEARAVIQAALDKARGAA